MMNNNNPDMAFPSSLGKVIKCPVCGIHISKIDGCNYIKCTICKTEICFECVRIKYKECNDKSHNSH